MPIQPGTQLGAYVLEESIGRGSLGTVYRARHQTQQSVAVVKLLQPLAGDPEAKARFRNEMQAVTRLRHPNVLTVYDFGEFEGVPYVVEEYAPGGRLADRIAGGRRLERRAAVAVLRGVAAGLDHAHAAGVLHGDVNPANVLFGYEDTPLLADFGLARLLQQPPSPGTTAVPSGDPAYIAPERVSGGGAGPAADNYAFAAMVYELLTGHVPFAGQGGLEQLYAHVHKDPPPPSTYDPSLPRAVDAVVLAGLAKDPGRRWPSCVEMIDGLEAALAGGVVESVEAVQPVDEVGVDEERRNRLPLFLALGAAAVLLIALVVFLVVRSQSGGPTLILSQDTVKPGDSLVVRGQNLPTNQPGTLQIESNVQQLGTFRTDSKGSFQAEVTIPTGLSGTHLIRACLSGSCPASQSVNVSAAPSPSPSESPSPSATPTPTAAPTAQPTAPPTPTPTPSFSPTITPLSKTTLKPGDSLQLSGGGFDPARMYVIAFEQNGVQTVVQSATQTPPNGTFVATVQIPTKSPTPQAGPAMIVACITSPGQPARPCAQLPIIIQP